MSSLSGRAAAQGISKEGRFAGTCQMVKHILFRGHEL